MKYIINKHPIVSSIVELVAGVPAYKKGDRVIVNFGKTKTPEYYAGTVSGKRLGLVYVSFDDGDKGSYKPTRSLIGLVGLIKGKRKRKTEIPKDQINNWLLMPIGEAAPTRSKKNTVVKKTKPKIDQTFKTFKITKSVKNLAESMFDSGEKKPSVWMSKHWSNKNAKPGYPAALYTANLTKNAKLAVDKKKDVDFYVTIFPGPLKIVYKVVHLGTDTKEYKEYAKDFIRYK